MCGGAIGDVIDAVENISSNILDTVMPITLDIVTLGNGDAAWYSLSGDKYRDEKRIEEKYNTIQNMENRITAMQDRLGNKVFLEQIFKYGDIRRIKDLGTSYEQLTKEYEQMLNDYKNNQDGNFLVSITNFIPNVMSSLVYNVLDYIRTGDTASLRTAISIGLLLAAIVLAVLASPISGGSSLSMVEACIVILSTILTLDAMVNNSGLLGSAFKILDIVVNKVLHLDSVLHTEGFDDDSQYYQSMMSNTRLVAQIAAIAVSINSMISTAPADLSTATGRMATRNSNFGSYAGNIESGVPLPSQTIILQTSDGLSSAGGSSEFVNKIKEVYNYKVAGQVSLSDLYSAFSVASNVNDVYGAMTLRAELSKKLDETKEDMQRKINKDNRKKMEGSYADAEYIMNQTDMSYHSYVLQMSESGQSDVFDPQGTIVMNTRYHPAKSYTFGFEDMFQYDGMAGGQLYVYNTLWK